MNDDLSQMANVNRGEIYKYIKHQTGIKPHIRFAVMTSIGPVLWIKYIVNRNNSNNQSSANNMERKEFDYAALESPKDKRTAESLAKTVGTKMFKNTRYHYKLKDVFDFLNELSEFPYAPNQSKIPWGDALSAIVSLQEAMQCIGVRGTAEAMNVKKAVMAMLTAIDPTTKKATNRALLNALAPHTEKSKNAKPKFVTECVERRAQFEETKDAAKLYHDDKKKGTNDSLE